MLALNGLAAVANAQGFAWVKGLGAAYLCWLGVSLWRTNVEPTSLDPRSSVSGWANLISGFLITLGDPKAMLFYLSFFPAYVNLATLSRVDIGAVLAIALVSVGGVKLMYAYLAGRSRQLFQNTRARQMMNRIAGTVMVLTGAALVMKP